VSGAIPHPAELRKEKKMQVKTYNGYREFMFLKNNAAFLPNGRRIDMIDYGEHCDRGVVMAFQGDDDAMPYVTWEFYRGDLASTSYGHYFKTKGEAIADYLKRLDEMRQDDYLESRRMEEDAQASHLRLVGE
jgi:hypothetical protein